MNTHLWTWSGRDFGHRDGDELWTYDGRHVGHFHDAEIYGPDGSYLGELQRDDHLITRTAKLLQHRKAFTPLPDRPARAAFIGFNRFELPKGYQDFPSPGTLRRQTTPPAALQSDALAPAGAITTRRTRSAFMGSGCRKLG